MNAGLRRGQSVMKAVMKEAKKEYRAHPNRKWKSVVSEKFADYRRRHH